MHSIDITNVSTFLLSLPAGGVLVVLIAQAIKKFCGMDSDKAIHAMVMLVSLAATAAAYVIEFKNLPPTILGVSGPAIYGFSQGVYHLAKALGTLLPKVQDAMRKPDALPANIASLDLDVPEDLVKETPKPAVAAAAPAETESTEFNF